MQSKKELLHWTVDVMACVGPEADYGGHSIDFVHYSKSC